MAGLLEADACGQPLRYSVRLASKPRGEVRVALRALEGLCFHGRTDFLADLGPCASDHDCARALQSRSASEGSADLQDTPSRNLVCIEGSTAFVQDE